MAAAPVVRVTTKRPKRAPRGEAFQNIGTSGLRRYSGHVTEEFISELRGKRAIAVYREMSDNDPTVGAALLAIEQAIRKVGWFVSPAQKMKDTQKGEEAAAFLQSCLMDMSCTWDEMMSEVVTFLTYGWAWMEMSLKVRLGENRNKKLNSKFDDGKIGFRKISLRMQQSLESWEFDDDGEVIAMNQQAAPYYRLKRISRKKSLLFRTKAIGNNPEGRSILRNAYRPWFIKKTIEEIEAIGMERDLIGLPIIFGPEGFDIESEDNESMRNAINVLFSQLRRDERDGLYLPFGWEIELLGQGSQTRKQFDTDRIINRWDQRTVLALLAQAILLGANKTGSFALSRTQTDDFFKVSVQGYLQSIAAVFNRFMIPFLFKYNPSFNLKPADYPTLNPERVTGPTLKEVGDFIKATAGAQFFKDDMDLRGEIERALHRYGGFSEFQQIGGVRLEEAPPKVTPPVNPGANKNPGKDGGASPSNTTSTGATASTGTTAS